MSGALRILYAEDNAQDADLTQTHFIEYAHDFEIEVVESGQSCLERLSRGDCDLLLLDHHLPDMEGLDVLKSLVHAGIRVPVVLVTGVGDETLVVKALRLGAASYVPKLGNYLSTLPDLLRLVIEDHRRKLSQGLLASVTRRILYVEHQEMDIELTLRHFAEAAPQFEIEVARTCADALARLARPPVYDVGLIDLRMPDQSGLDFVREAQQRRLPLPPFIMISGMGDEAAAIASLKLGAADYVAKREGYLDQLQYTMERAIAYDRLARLSEQLRAELSERTRVEDALRESEARFRDIFERSTVGKALTGPDGKLLKVNQAFADMLGYSIEEMQQLTVAEITHLDDLAEGQECLRSLLAGERMSCRVEKRYKHRDGHLVYADMSATLLSNPQGAPSCVLASIVDVSERRHVEGEREKLEAQFRQAQRMESIGRLAGGIAHDFNNLLSVILCGTEFAMERARDDDRIRDELLEVHKAGTRAAVLTRQLLAFSRKQVLQPSFLNMNQIAAGVEKMLRRILGEDIDFVQVLAPDLGVVWADPGQVEQVLMNLVVNARDAMPDGGKLTLETSNLEVDEEYSASHLDIKPGPFVQFAVTDTGCGMDDMTKARIFEPFFTTKEIGKGTGLGLSTVYGIVKQSGGNIGVYSEPGHGTTFRIYLPRVQPAGAAAQATPAITTRTTGAETILVVEDDAAIRSIAKRILGSAGYAVLTATSAAEALLLFDSHQGKIHLLLTDVVMPQMGGRALAERMAVSHSGIKVLYMSGYTDDAIAHHGTLDPGTHFIAKPFSVADLTRKVRETLDS